MNPTRALLALALLTLTACHRPAEPAASAAPVREAIEMRAYDVPQSLAPELRGVIDRLLAWGEKGEVRLGRAALGPGGRLVVSATPAVHAGIEQLVAGLRDDPPAEPAVVEMTYWLVEARPADAPSDPPPALAALRPALDAITAADGPRRFTPIETLRLRSAAGEHGEIEGRRVKAHQTASVRGGDVLARIDLRHRGGGFETDLALPLDTLLVLGQTGADPPAGDDGAPPGDLYYIVRARVASPTAP